MLKVTFAEVDRTKLEQFGINILQQGAAKYRRSDYDRPVLAISGFRDALPNAIGAPAKGFTTQPFGE